MSTIVLPPLLHMMGWSEPKPKMGVAFCDPRIHPDEKPRLETQARKILAALMAGPKTNKDLAAMSLKYTGRISDLRKSGFDIRVTKRDRVTGTTTYELFEIPEGYLHE